MKKNILLLIILKSSFCMAQEYKVLPMIELLTMIDDMQEQFEYSDSVTMAVVYKANNGKFIIKPAVGLKGLLVNNKFEVDAILKKGIPIEEDRPNPFQTRQSDVQNIEANTPAILDNLKMILGVSAVTFDSSFLKVVNRAINGQTASELYSNVFFSLGVYLGEYVKSLKGGGEWKLQKRFGYNPYHVPVLLGNDGYIYDPWYKLADLLLKKSKKDLNQQLILILNNKIYNSNNK